MKVLFTVLSYLVIIIANEVLGALTGFKAGYLIVIILAGAISAALCKAYDKKHKPPVPYTFEQIKHEVKFTVLEACEENRGNDEELKSLLDIYTKNKIIPKDYESILFEEYRRK